ncbi:polypeptide N-acetylgalactosaminyltransferase 5 [Vulpes vulpes]|uniref:Polypeptide N-acetylgalactosaminyltransferase n=1 Tax=Vulpes vulpes TaxID=9627 RepID=A0A3Q7S2R2_VULVU
MNGLRKFFRGSGRVLAFVFAASVLWLLFDMAALRLSFSDAGSRLLQARGVRGQPVGVRARPDRDPAAPPLGGGEGGRPPARPRGQGPGPRERPRGAAGTALRADAAPAAAPTDGRTRRAGGRVAARRAPAPLQPRAGRDLGPTGARGSAPGTAPGAPRAPPAAAPGGRAAATSARAGRVGAAAEAPTAPGLRAGPRAPAAGRAPWEGGGPASPAVPEPRGAGALDATGPPSRAPAASRGRAAGTLAVSQPGASSGGPRGRPAGAPGPGAGPAAGAAAAAAGRAPGSPAGHVVIVTKGEEPRPEPKQVPRTEAEAENKAELPAAPGDGRGPATSARRSQAAVPTVPAAAEAPPAGAPPAGLRQSRRGARSPAPRAVRPVSRVDATLSPRDPKAPGQFGRPVVVPRGKEKEAERRWKEGNFNVYLSDLIPVDRAIEDTRPAGCAEQLVHSNLPTTSVIMCFVDEVWSTLLRSVHSVLNRSPPHLIKEILLVDDFSTKDYLKDDLDKYMSQFPKVRILRLKERHGLIRARLAGAQNATGDVLTFLDSHVECNVGWLEPLLERVYLSRKKVACPVIEVINDKDMSYMTVDNFQRGIFVWPMNFGWRTIPPDVVAKNRIKETDIIRCPVMAGGLFSIDKNYFFELGTYDPGLDVWGGENMELSFKVWMCGGEIEIIPCSRVGHIFRNDNPYSFPKDRMKTVERNLVRVAEVWLDEYKELFYGHGDHLIDQGLDVGNLTEQRELRKKLKCKSFKWYLENVFPDLKAPIVRANGVLINVALGKCISIENTTATLEDCDGSSELQQFNYTWLRLIKHEEWCLAPIPDTGALRLHPCDNRNKGLKWLHKSASVFHPELVNHIVFGNYHQLLCLEGNVSQKTLKVAACDPMKQHQKWKFEKYYED